MANSHFPDTGNESIVVTSAPLDGDGSQGDPVTLPTSAQPILAALGVGDLAAINTDPIFGTAAQIGDVTGITYTDTTKTAYGTYTAISVEPSANSVGIAIGHEILVNEPDTNTHSMNQFYGLETFIYHNSTQGATSAIGQNSVIQWAAGALSASMTGYLAQVQNDGAGAITGTIRGMGVTCGNNGAGTATTIESLKVNTPTGAGVTNVYGLRLLDQTFSGASINRAIDVNNKFVVAADGGGLTVTGPVKGTLTTTTNATTGLVAGVLAATTNASIVVTDGAGQVYRIPCII